KLLATPTGRSAASSLGERSERDRPGSFVSLVGLCQLVKLLGDKAAQRHSAAGGHDLRVPDGRLVELDGQITLGHVHSVLRGPRNIHVSLAQATSGAARVLITRSGPIPNRSARAQPPSSQSSWPGACASVSMANTQPISTASRSRSSGGSWRSGRQLISTATSWSRQAVNTASASNADCGRPRPTIIRPVQWPS